MSSWIGVMGSLLSLSIAQLAGELFQVWCQMTFKKVYRQLHLSLTSDFETSLDHTLPDTFWPNSPFCFCGCRGLKQWH